jgi:hypothetical protein
MLVDNIFFLVKSAVCKLMHRACTLPRTRTNRRSPQLYSSVTSVLLPPDSSKDSQSANCPPLQATDLARAQEKTNLDFSRTGAAVCIHQSCQAAIYVAPSRFVALAAAASVLSSLTRTVLLRQKVRLCSISTPKYMRVAGWAHSKVGSSSLSRARDRATAHVKSRFTDHVATTTPSSFSFQRQRNFPTHPTSNQPEQHVHHKSCCPCGHSSDATSSFHAELAATRPRYGHSPSRHYSRATGLHRSALSIRYHSSASSPSHACDSYACDKCASCGTSEWHGQFERSTRARCNGCGQGGR